MERIINILIISIGIALVVIGIENDLIWLSIASLVLIVLEIMSMDT